MAMTAANFIKLRGLPYTAGERDVVTFLQGLPVFSEESVIVTVNDEGRPSGEALVRLEEAVPMNELRVYNGRYIGTRFIEVFPSSQNEFFNQENKSKMSDATIIRIRGLPYDTTKEDIFMFFARLMISRDGVGLLIGPDDIPTGEAFIQFMSREDANMALLRNNQSIRSRYIEVYKSSTTEAIRAMERQYEINREEILNGSRNMSQNNQPGRAHLNQGGYYNEPVAYGGMNNNNFGGPMRRGRDTSKIRATPYGGKAAPIPASRQFSDPNQMTIYMRGLPYSASEQDVYDFFTPLQLAGVKVFRGNDGKLTGEAEAEFLTQQDAIQGMEKDRCKMSWRYIELFTSLPEKV